MLDIFPRRHVAQLGLMTAGGLSERFYLNLIGCVVCRDFCCRIVEMLRKVEKRFRSETVSSRINLGSRALEDLTSVGDLDADRGIWQQTTHDHVSCSLPAIWSVQVQSLLEMDLGNKMQHMSEILEKVDVVLAGEDDASLYGRGVGGGGGDSREIATGTTNGNNDRAHTEQSHQPITHSHTTTQTPQNAKLYEASNTYAPDTIVGASQR